MRTPFSMLATIALFGCVEDTTTSDVDAKSEFTCDLRTVSHGGTFEKHGDTIDLTGREARLILDMTGRADAAILGDTNGAALYEGAQDSIIEARNEYPESLCTIGDLLNQSAMGIGNLRRLKAFSPVWEMSKEGADRFGPDADGRGVSQADRLPIAELAEYVGTFEGMKLTRGEAMLVAEMANYASFSELDEIKGFHRDTAHAIKQAAPFSGDAAGMDAIADVHEMGPAHLGMMMNHTAGWADSMRTSFSVCKTFVGDLQADTLDMVRAITPRVCDADKSFDEMFADEITVEGITFTARQAALVVDAMNDAPEAVLFWPQVMDNDAAESIMVARADLMWDGNASVPDEGTHDDVFCSLEEIAEIDNVGPAALVQLRRLSAMWDVYSHKHTIDADSDAVNSADREGYTENDGVPTHFGMEKDMVLMMANHASEGWLDAISATCVNDVDSNCGFYSTAAKGIADAREAEGFDGFQSYAELDAVTNMGPSHIGLMVQAIPEFATMARQVSLNGCSGEMDAYFSFDN